MFPTIIVIPFHVLFKTSECLAIRFNFKNTPDNLLVRDKTKNKIVFGKHKFIYLCNEKSCLLIIIET